MRAEEPPYCVADIAETCQAADWLPQFDLKAGLSQTWAWRCSTKAAQRQAA
jgi:hypothetical protein